MQEKVWSQLAIKNLHAVLRWMGRSTFYLTLRNEQQIEMCRGQVAAQWGKVHEPRSASPELPAANNSEQLHPLSRVTIRQVLYTYHQNQASSNFIGLYIWTTPEVVQTNCSCIRVWMQFPQNEFMALIFVPKIMQSSVMIVQDSN